MDKQTTLGFILIGLVLIVWMWIQTPPPAERQQQVDTTKAIQATPQPVIPPTESHSPHSTSSTNQDSLGRFFSHLAAGKENVLIVETDRYVAEVTTKGGLIRRWELKDYKTWDQNKVELIDGRHGGDLSLLFTTTDGKLINTRNLFFSGKLPNWRRVVLKGEDSFSFQLELEPEPGKKIIKEFVFTNGKYSLEVDFKMSNMQSVIANYEYQITWETGLRYAERNSVDESNFAKAFAYSGGELTEADAASVGEVVKKEINGSTSWVSTRTKYFAVALLPEEGKCQGAYLEGIHLPQPDRGVKEDYSISLKMPYKGEQLEQSRVTVFLGPLDYDVVKSYNRGLDQVMSLGFAWVIRPITEFVMIPLFQVLKMFIPNFGFVIIVFSIIIKLALHPLTKTSMRSMKRMQALQPLMNELREKYKDDPQKMNQQVMNLYKEYGVNPAAGCLPLLLQMPILFALYSVFQSSIELRQASFVWWIHDLSIPDSILKLPFSIPLFGITEVSGLALAMGITMFIQQKMTVTDPRQKAMVWMMPVMMTLLFNSFPSGLNLYYFVFNILSIGQQVWITKHHGDEPLRKVDPKKGSKGIMARLTKDLPKLK